MLAGSNNGRDVINKYLNSTYIFAFTINSSSRGSDEKISASECDINRLSNSEMMLNATKSEKNKNVKNAKSYPDGSAFRLNKKKGSSIPGSAYEKRTSGNLLPEPSFPLVSSFKKSFPSVLVLTELNNIIYYYFPVFYFPVPEGIPYTVLYFFYAGRTSAQSGASRHPLPQNINNYYFQVQ